ncbi:MAG: CDP-alcohol phosphatidyltransferase family protein [Candidatus Rokuibacteriota bacterium]|nr:MAG: CDP-alcohol phosphatidyltransferase family protein [Candidatus Rokubacteria bacterium]
MIQQAALYLVTADDVQAARLRVAGRPVAFRAILAAVRAGIRRVAVPTVLRSPDLEAALATSGAARAAVVWLDDAAALAELPTLFVPAAALGPADALRRLAAAPAGSVLAESLSVDAPLVVADAALLRALRAPLAAGTPLGETLERGRKTRELAVVSSGRWYVRVVSPRAAAAAEDRLYAELGSPIDTPLDIAVHRRLSRFVSRAAVAAGIGPNPITLASGVVGLAAVAAFARADVAAVVAGLGLYVLAVILDHADGEVARLTLSESRLGEWLDIVVDTIVHGAMLGALGLAATRVAGGGWTAGLVAAAAVVVSGLLAKVWPPSPASADRNVLDRLTSRDGFYLMLLAFVLVRLVDPARLPALMILIAVGAHVYWVTRVLSLLRKNTCRTPK